jgi:hypothetical protein
MICVAQHRRDCDRAGDNHNIVPSILSLDHRNPMVSCYDFVSAVFALSFAALYVLST